ncbi:R3H domain-containing protein 1, partial [Lobosporangium transversale]
MAQNSGDSKPATVDDTIAASAVNGEQATATDSQQQQQKQQQPVFTILRPNANTSESSPCTVSGSNTPLTSTEHSSASQEQVAGLTRTLEGLELEDDSNDTGGDMALDEFLVNALKNRQDRIFLLKLDREFCSFLNNPSQEQLEFPSLNSYYRMVIHRVANYFKITRAVDPQNRKIILYKTEQSAIPPLRFSDLVEEEEEQPIKQMKLLKRNPNRPASGTPTPEASTEPDRKTISIKEREEAYARARARIFQEDASSKSKSDGSGSNSRCDSSPVTAPLGDSPRQESCDDSLKNKNGRKQTNGRRTGSGTTRSQEEQNDVDSRQQNQSSPNSRSVSRSTSPSPLPTIGGQDSNPKSTGKGLGPKTKQSKGDLAAECADPKRRKSTASNTSSSSNTVKTPIGLARTISSSSSQDGFQSPNLGSIITESPSTNSPSNSAPSKAYDYFGQNPTSNSGSVSPMSSGSSRASFSYSHPGGHKQHRNHPNNNNTGGNHASGFNYGHQSSGPGFVKGINAPAFVPKKSYPKHGNSHTPMNSGFNNGPITYQSGPSSQGHPFSNGTNTPYVYPQPGTSSPWPERGIPTGHDGPTFYNSSQDSNPAFPHGNTLTQYPSSGPNMLQQPYNINTNPPNSSHNHVNNHQQPFHSSQRGGRRNPNSKQHYGHQPHFQHPHHARTHPQMHHSQYHHGNNNNNNNNNYNYNMPSSRDDFSHAQRFGRPFEGNVGQVPPLQFGPDFYPTHSMPGDIQAGPNMYPGFINQPLTTSPNESF